MWLLNTSSAELHFFSSAYAVGSGYAILSHRWSQDEQTFHDIKHITERCRVSGTTPIGEVSHKIQECCRLAAKDGHEWLWIDSCCIDKTSSSELSEAINSMFLWYSQAEVCYAYLEDVSSDCILDEENSEFRRSQWHTRGWTLQELIAPATVIFYSKDWELLGTKSELCDLLQDITGVWSEILEQKTTLWAVGIAVRMHWASKRRTTRVEDEAYCLMGLFGVNMPIIYGEGRHAFHRLQLEIIKNAIDTSLFTWGSYLPLRAHNDLLMYDGDHSVSPLTGIQYLLARSPADFDLGSTFYMPMVARPLEPYTEMQKALHPNQVNKIHPDSPFDNGEIPRFQLTNYGMKCRFPIIESDGLTVAVLLCERFKEHLGLLLHRSARSLDPKRPLYHTSASFLHRDGVVGQGRTISLGKNLYDLQLWGKPVKAVWRTIYITVSPDFEDSPDTPFFRLQLNHRKMAFRFPHWLITQLTSLFTVGHRQYEDTADFRIHLSNPSHGEHIHLDVGRCVKNPSPEGPAAWARVTICHRNQTRIPEIGHSCAVDHVSAWPLSTEKRFGDAERTVRFSFRRDVLARSDKLLAHLELEGTVYRRLLQEVGVRIPTREVLDEKEAVLDRRWPSRREAPSGSQKGPRLQQHNGLPRKAIFMALIWLAQNVPSGYEWVELETAGDGVKVTVSIRLGESKRDE